MDKAELYWQTRLNSLERRIECLEAEARARSVNQSKDSDCYTINEFAQALGVSRLTISRRIKSGVITAVKIGKYWKIPKNELKKIFDE